MKNIYMSAYDINSAPTDKVLSADGLNFKNDEPFFLICNLPVKDKCMFEFVVNSYYPINSIRHIPLYVGISREPSSGVLAADFCISSLYYENGNPKYDIMSNMGAANEYHQYIDGSYTDADGNDKVGCRKPGILDTIGVACNVPENKIVLFVNYTSDSEKAAYNKPFYSYTPPFTIADEPNMYFCIWSDIYYKKITEDHNYASNDSTIEAKKYISGIINFGKMGLNHPVEGYKSMYSLYFDQLTEKDEISKELGTEEDPCSIKIVGNNYEYYATDKDAEVSVLNALIPNTDYINLLSANTNVAISNKFTYAMDESVGITSDSNYGDTNAYLKGSSIFINFPIPKSDKIYFEFTAKESQLKKNTIGIPLSVGVVSIPRDVNTTPTFQNATMPGTILGESIRLNLFRGSPYIDSGLTDTAGYFLYHVINNISENNNGNELFAIRDIDTSVPPVQGKTIGIALDLGHNKMTVIVDNIKMTTLSFPTTATANNPFTVDMTKSSDGRTEYAYFFIHDEGVFTGTIKGTFNIGKTAFDNTLPSGYESLYDFYTVDLRRTLSKMIDCTVYINSNKIINSFIFSSVNINNIVDTVEGLNKLINSKNIISDIYPHYYDLNEADFKEMNSLMSSENNGYVPSAYKGTSSVEINYKDAVRYTINMAKYKNQLICVRMNNVLYTDTFEAPENARLIVTVKAISGLEYEYSPGDPSVSRATVSGDMYITASKATYKEYNVTIIQSLTQTITVYQDKENGILEEHTTSFIVNSRYPNITAKITKVKDGYTPGILNITATKVSNDIVIYCTDSSSVRYTVHLLSTPNEVITTIAEGITRTNEKGTNIFDVGYKKPIKVDILGNPGYLNGALYYYGADNIHHFIASSIPEVSEDITVTAEEAKPDVCDITVNKTDLFTYTLDSYTSKVDTDKYTAGRRTEVIIHITPKDGYYVDNTTLDITN